MNRIYALVIGINEYPNFPPQQQLHGCENDANKIENYLKTQLNVPEVRIKSLRSRAASQKAIVTAIEALATNDEIKSGDPILIYYSGHGGRENPPLDWPVNSEDGQLEFIVPSDFSWREGNGVFDYMLNRLLEKLATAKSNNISVIFDCCHSGSGTRDVANNSDAETPKARYIKGPEGYRLPKEGLVSIDQGLGTDAAASRGTSIAAGGETAGMRSHVLLAAAKRGQYSWEFSGSGWFTSSLLKLLDGGIGRLTYQEVVLRLPWFGIIKDNGGNKYHQDPQCEGVNRNRYLFTTVVADRAGDSYPISASSSNSREYTLDAGTAHGITEKAEFAVFGDKNSTSPLLTVVAGKPDLFVTQCTSTESKAVTLTETAYATLTRAGEGQQLRVDVGNAASLSSLVTRLAKELDGADASRRGIRLVNPNEHADLKLSDIDGKVQFDITEQRCLEIVPAMARLRYDDIGVNDPFLLSVLRGAADFFWHFQHSPERGFASQMLDFKCVKLVQKQDERLAKYYAEGEEAQTETTRIGGKTIVFAGDGESPHGFKIANNSSLNLYVALFYFDFTGLSITTYYQPTKAAQEQKNRLEDDLQSTDFSLPAGKTLTIGYGDGGGVAWKYEIGQGLKAEAGFLKLYASTKYVDWSGIEQGSPFVRGSKGGIRAPLKQEHMWDSVVFPVVIR